MMCRMMKGNTHIVVVVAVVVVVVVFPFKIFLPSIFQISYIIYLTIVVFKACIHCILFIHFSYTVKPV